MSERNQAHIPHEVIAFENVSFRYPRVNEPTLENINFTIRQGESITLIGPNGGGKTTCLFLLIGHLKPQSGHIRIMGKPPTRTQSLINGVFQKSYLNQPSFPIRVKEFVSLGGIELPKTLRTPRIATSLETMELSAFAKKTLPELSAGQRQRVFIARALMNDAPILLFDEPTANLDERSETRFYAILKKLRSQKKTILLVSHDISVAPAFSDKIFCVNKTLHSIPSQDFNPKTLKHLYTENLTVMGHSHYTP